MAGVTMYDDEGTYVSKQSVPSIGGPAPIVSGGHVGDGNRANGVSYNTDNSIGVGGPDGNGYPAGTAMKDNTPGEGVN